MDVRTLTARINELESWKATTYTLSENEKVLNEKVADLQWVLAATLAERLKNRTADPLTYQEEQDLRAKRLIPAIKSVRERLNMSLMEAKNYCQDRAVNLGLAYCDMGVFNWKI